jgi:hypothetical protein
MLLPPAVGLSLKQGKKVAAASSMEESEPTILHVLTAMGAANITHVVERKWQRKGIVLVIDRVSRLHRTSLPRPSDKTVEYSQVLSKQPW